jgi:beta-carotene 3-hydroxylase
MPLVELVLLNAALLVASFVAMEGVAWALHRYVMHGWGWGWHRSHHAEGEGRLGPFELNDLYAVVMGAVAFALIWFASRNGHHPAYYAGLGMSLYGLVYFLAHDVLVHRRIPLRWTPKSGYLKRLVQAHRLHHATHGREGAVSFGFLYAPPVRRLKAELQARQAKP